MSMRDLGQAVGISSSYISRIEKDERVPTLQLVYRLAEHLSVDRNWLATGTAIHEQDQELLALRRENERLRRMLEHIRSLADETLSL